MEGADMFDDPEELRLAPLIHESLFETKD